MLCIRKNNIPLTKSLLHLLQTSVDLSTTDAKTLAESLSLSPETIRTEFKRICQLMNVHSRSEAIIEALKHGWVTLPPTQQNTSNEY